MIKTIKFSVIVWKEANIISDSEFSIIYDEWYLYLKIFQ